MSVTTRPKRPLSRRIQARVMSALNVPMRRVLALPVATPLSDRLMLLYVTGRRSGKAYRQPVSYVRDGDALLTPGGGNWKLNLVPGRPERIRLRGRDVLARPEIISDVDEIEPLLARMIKANPMVGRFVGVGKAPDGQLDRGPLETAVRHGFRVIRWHLEEPTETQS
jgi:F420H(2)-dependent quinone reductase